LILLNKLCSSIINRLKQKNSRPKYKKTCRNADLSFKLGTGHNNDQDRF